MARTTVKLWGRHGIFFISLMTCTVYIYLLILVIEPSSSAKFHPVLSSVVDAAAAPPEIHSDKQSSPSTAPKFDRHPSYPWAGDPECQHFSVQVTCLPKRQKDNSYSSMKSYCGSWLNWVAFRTNGP